MFKDEIEKKNNLKKYLKKYQIQPVLAFKTNNFSHEPETNTIENKPKNNKAKL